MPDIIVGDMQISHRSYGASQDTLLVAEGFNVCTGLRAWLPGQTSIWAACYVDGVLANEMMVPTFDPYWRPCIHMCIWPIAGIATPGSHAITVVFDSRNTIAETNENNNMQSREVTVVSP